MTTPRSRDELAEALRKAWSEGHNAGIGCGHDLAVCRHDDGTEEVKDLAYWDKDVAALLAPDPGVAPYYDRERVAQELRDASAIYAFPQSDPGAAPEVAVRQLVDVEEAFIRGARAQQEAIDARAALRDTAAAPEWETFDDVDGHKSIRRRDTAPALDEPTDAQFMALATAVMQVREFIALHLKTKRRSDVNGRKVLALIDEALSEGGRP